MSLSAFATSTMACAAGAGPGAAHEDPSDGGSDDDTAAFGLFDADPLDAPSNDAGADAPLDDGIVASPPEAAVDAAVDAAPADRCASRSDGAYCASRFTSGGLDVHDLVHCASGVTASIDTCVAGCVDVATGTDECHADPCVTASFGGLYCGQSTQNGFGGGLVDWLYDCESGKTKSSTPCAKGCAVEPSGTEDKCL